MNTDGHGFNAKTPRRGVMENRIFVLRPPSPFILSPQERRWLLADFDFADDVRQIQSQVFQRNGERNLAKPKAARPSERARASPRRDEGARV
jgi:hypothetical protein